MRRPTCWASMYGARHAVGAARRCNTLRGLTRRSAGSRFRRRDDASLHPVIAGKIPAARPILAAWRGPPAKAPVPPMPASSPPTVDDRQGCALAYLGRRGRGSQDGKLRLTADLGSWRNVVRVISTHGEGYL